MWARAEPCLFFSYSTLAHTALSQTAISFMHLRLSALSSVRVTWVPLLCVIIKAKIKKRKEKKNMTEAIAKHAAGNESSQLP